MCNSSKLAAMVLVLRPRHQGMGARLLLLLTLLLLLLLRVDARKKRTADAPVGDAPVGAEGGSLPPQSANPMANPDSNPGDLTRSEFVELVGGELAVVNFYAKWCEPCKAFAPEWEAAVEKLAALDPPIKAGQIDAEMDELIAKRYNISSYPGIAVFRRDNHYLIPPAEFSADGIVDHMLHQRKLQLPSQQVKSVRAVERISQSVWRWDDHPANVAVILGLFPKGADSPEKRGRMPAPGAQELEMFGDLSFQLHTRRLGFAFAHSFDPAVHSHFHKKFLTEFEGGTNSNGTLVVVLGEQMRATGRKFDMLGGLLGTAEIERHPDGHALVDLSALLAAHSEDVSTQGRDQTHHTDGSDLSPGERESRMQIYLAAVMELADWVVPACTTAPLVGELNPANTPFSPHPLYDLPLFIFFYSDPASVGAWRRQLGTIATDTAGDSTQGSKLKFALAAMSTFKASLPDLGIDSTKAPHTAAVIVDANKRKYRLLPEETPANRGQAIMQKSLTARRVGQFVKSYYAGQLKPHLRSAPALPDPETPGLVRDVVGSTFEQHVTGESAPEHVLIQLYSPRSSTCRVLAPYYHNLSVALASHSDPIMQRISVAVIDVDQNDTPPPFDANGLPTVYLSSRGARDSPIRMEVQGSADEIVPNMLAFLKEHTAGTAASSDTGEGDAEQPTATATVDDDDRDL